MIELSIAPPGRVKRHGNQRPMFGKSDLQTRVGKSLTRELAELGCKVKFALVFQPVNKIQRTGVAG